MIDGKGPDVSQIDVMTLNNFMVVLILHYIIQIIFRIIFFRATSTLVRCRTKRSSFITPWLSENRKLIKIAWIRVKWFRSQKVNYCFERDTIDACVNIALMFSRMFFYPIHSFRDTCEFPIEFQFEPTKLIIIKLQRRKYHIVERQKKNWMIVVYFVESSSILEQIVYGITHSKP